MENNTPTREKKATRQAKNIALTKAAACIPNTWLDPLLSGEKKVVGKYPFGCPDIERLLNRIRANILSLKSK